MNDRKKHRMQMFQWLLAVMLTVLTAAATEFHQEEVYAATNSQTGNIKADSDVQTPAEYTKIYDVNGLYKINADTKGNYILMNDIDLSETNRGTLDAGKGWVPLKQFSGTLDGNGYRIKNMTIHGSLGKKAQAGLFARLDGTIKNLGLIGVSIDIDANDSEVGSLAGRDDSGAQISNCFVTGRIQVADAKAEIGGIVGSQWGSISQCYTNVTVIGDEASYTGGISGSLRSKGSCVNCYAVGSVNSKKSGMICAYRASRTSSIEGCYYLATGGMDEDGTALTSAQMRMSGSFPTFDFKEMWMLDNNSSYPNPQLRACLQIRPTSITMSSQPLKQEYLVDEPLDLAGAAIDVVYEDGRKANIAVTEYMVDCDMSVGTQSVPVIYGGCKAYFDITVKKTEPVVKVNTDYDKVVGDIFFLDASTDSGGDLTYASENAGIASIDADGRVEALRSGTVTLTVTSDETDHYAPLTKKVTLTIHAPTVTVAKKKMILNRGSKALLGIRKTGTGIVTYQSSNKKVVSVTKSGKITGKKIGKAVITVTLQTNYYKDIVKKVTVQVR